MNSFHRFLTSAPHSCPSAQVVRARSPNWRVSFCDLSFEGPRHQPKECGQRRQSLIRCRTIPQWPFLTSALHVYSFCTACEGPQTDLEQKFVWDEFHCRKTPRHQRKGGGQQRQSLISIIWPPFHSYLPLASSLSLFLLCGVPPSN